MSDIVTPSGARLPSPNRMFAITADGKQLDLGDPQLALVEGVLRVVSSRKMLAPGLIVGVALVSGKLSAVQQMADPVPVQIGQTFTGRIEVPVIQQKPVDPVN